MIRTALTAVILLLGTIMYGSLVLLAEVIGVKKRPGSVFERAPVWWARWILRAAGVTVVRKGNDPLAPGSPRVFVANHVSWFDILAMYDVLPQYGFVAKSELENIPLFGSAARAVGVIYIDRDNLKAAFGAYDDASKKIQAGQSVAVYPEGTRGERYALRPFKKGPFVLAIAAGVPIVPVVIHGTIAVNPRGEFRASPGVVHIQLLDPIPTEGLTYDDREALADQTQARMAECLRDEFGVTPSIEPRRSPRSAPIGQEISA